MQILQNNLPKIFIDSSLSTISNDRDLLIVGFGFTNEWAVRRLKEMWAKRDSHTNAYGRDKKETDEIGAKDVGGIITLIDLNLDTHTSPKILAEMDVMTPMGLYFNTPTKELFVGSAYSIISIKNGTISRTLDNNLFSQIHGISSSPLGIYVACSNTDAIVEVDPSKPNENLWDWIATEHGFNITKKGEKRTISRDINYQKTEDNATLNHTTHVNSVESFDDNNILATLFHQNSLVMINKKTFELKYILRDIINPHAIHHIKNGFIVSDTRGNRSIILNKDLKVVQELKKDFDWVQDSIEFNKYYIVGNDNKHELSVFDVKGGFKQEFVWKENTRKLSSLLKVSGGEAKNIFLP